MIIELVLTLFKQGVYSELTNIRSVNKGNAYVSLSLNPF